MKNIFVLLFIFVQVLASIVAPGQAAVTNVPVTSTQLPVGWTSPGVPVSIDNSTGRADNFSVRISSEGSFLVSARLSDVQLLNFYCRVPQYEDDYIVLVESSTDGTTWRELGQHVQKFDPSKYTAENKNAFSSATFTYNVAGTVQFRWSLKNRTGGSALLDDFSYSAIPDAQNDQAATQRDLSEKEAELKRLIAEQGIFANYQNAQNRFSETAFSLRSNIHLLSNLLDKSTNLYLISTTADKLAKRNEMVNPWSYDKFKNFVSTLDTKLPTVKKIQLQDLLNIVKVPLMAADKLLLGGALTTFSTSVKSLVGDAFSPATLKAMGIGNNQVAAQEQLGVSMYNDAKDFLGILISENDKVTRLNSSIAVVSVESNEMMQLAEKQLMKYLKLLDYPSPDAIVARLKTSRNLAVATIEAHINSYTQRQLGDLAKFTANQNKLTASQNVFLAQVLNLNGETDLLRVKYSPLTSKMLSFYNNLKNDASAPNPFTVKTNSALFDASTVDKWTSFQTDITANLDTLINTFKLTYIEYNLYD